MDWSVLGIEATKDKKAITKAYRSKLIHTNPEDKPEEFKALRAAYEEALALADQEDEPEEEKTPLDRWLDKLAAIYSNFRDRKNVDCWRELLTDDICQALDTRPDAEEMMLRFFMEHYHLTHRVWVYLDQEFSFLERKGELYEKYPKDFVDYIIINGIRYEDNVPYDLYVPGENAAECERIIRLYNQISSTSIDTWAEPIAELEKLSEHHPYTDALSLKYRIYHGESEAIGELKALSDKYPSDYYLMTILAEQYCRLGQWSEAEKAAAECLELKPDDEGGSWYLAQALAGQEKYEKAIEYLQDMMHRCVGDDNRMALLNSTLKKWNEELIMQYRKTLEENPDNPRMWLDLAWCYLQNDKTDKALECAGHIPENQPNGFDYNNLMCNLNFDKEDYEAALKYNGNLLAVLEDIQSGAAEDPGDKLKRFPEMLNRRGLILSLLDRYDEADEFFTRALDMKPESAEFLSQIVRTKIYTHKYEDALKYAEKFAEVMPQEYLPHYFLALIQKMLGDDRDAFNEINTAIDMDASDFRAYELKLIILIRNGVYDQAHELIDFLKEHGAGEAFSIRWCSTWLDHEEKKETDEDAEDITETLKIYQEIDGEIEKDSGEYHWFPEFYYQLANLTARDNNSKNNHDRQILIDILNKGLKANPEDPDCLGYKAWLLKKEKRYGEAREAYEKLVKKPHSGVYTERELASVYYAELRKYADKAAEFYERVVETDDNSVDRFYAGMSRFTTGDLEKAAEHFLKEEELDPDDVDGFYRLSYVYEAMGLYEEALREADLSIALVKTWKDKKCHSSHFEHKAQILRRMGKPEEAVKVYREAMALYGQEFNGHQLIVAAYMQFGMWDKAEEVMKEWKKSTPNVVGNKYNLPRLDDIVKLEFMQKKFLKAKLSFTNYSAAMYESDRDDLSFLLDSVSGSAKVYLKIRKKEMEKLKPDHPDYAGYLEGYVDALWMNGKFDEARKLAQTALDKLEDTLKGFYRNRTMHLTKKVSLLYLLGRVEEAESLAREIDKQPLCELCVYGGCKDLDIYRVRGQIYQGKKEEALKLIEKMQKRWPEETDFIFYENILKKGKL